MRQLRFILIAFITSLFVLNAALLRRIIAIFLCGVLSFNSVSYYGFLNQGETADAAPPSKALVSPSLTASHAEIFPKQEQKVAGCLFGLCVPKLPNIPGNPLEVVKSAIVKEIGQALGVGSPLLLDQNTAYPDVSDQVKDFRPKQLTITSAEDLQKPLPPGDYSLSVIAYCTQFSIHAPGQGLPYKLAPLKGKQAPAISALLSRGTLQNIPPATLNAQAWRIQSGLPLRQWSKSDQEMVRKLIPEYEKSLEGDYLQQIENTYNQFRLIPGIPSFNELLSAAGEPGKLVLQYRQARQLLTDQTIAAERLPDMLFEPTGNGLPRVLPPSKDDSPSRWAEVKPGIFARFTVIEGHLGRNLLEFRVTSKPSLAINNSATVATKELDKNLQVNNATDETIVTLAKIFDYGADSVLFIGYSIGQAAQALILAISIPNLCSHPPATPNTSTPLNTYRVISPNGPYKLTIYITGADNTPKTNNAFPGGHAWISLSDGETTNYYGFAPASSSSTIGTVLKLPYIFLPIGVRGTFQDERERPYEVFQEYTITQQGLRDAYQAILDWNDRYNLTDHNCATFASSIGIASGAISSQDISLTAIINPASLANYLLSHGGKKR